MLLQDLEDGGRYETWEMQEDWEVEEEMRKSRRTFEELPIGALFLVEEPAPAKVTVWEKCDAKQAHQFEMPDFNRIGGVWTFPLDGWVIELTSEFTGESPTKRRGSR